jgi:hypothetical protein
VVLRLRSWIVHRQWRRERAELYARLAMFTIAAHEVCLPAVYLLYRTAMRYNRGLDRDKDGIACEKL